MLVCVIAALFLCASYLFYAWGKDQEAIKRKDTSIEMMKTEENRRKEEETKRLQESIKNFLIPFDDLEFEDSGRSSHLGRTFSFCVKNYES